MQNKMQKTKQNTSVKIAVIGGGASGMMAAVTAARAGASVTVFERNDRLGKKILVTGNGKCNLSNERMSSDYFYGDKAFVGRALERFGSEDTKAFFAKLGLLLKERNGYWYPLSEQAASVLDVLRFKLESLGVDVITECKINGITKDKSGMLRITDGKKAYLFHKVIIACGGKAAPKTGSDGSGYKLAGQLGHTVTDTVPALVQLKCAEDYMKAVAGVRADGVISFCGADGSLISERGEVQLTEYGISGIPVFQISRVVNYILRQQKEIVVRLDFLPDYDADIIREMIRNREKSDRTAEVYFTGILNKKIMLLFMKLTGIKPTQEIASVSEDKIEQVFQLCKDWKLHITGSNSYENAQVSAGGVPLCEVTGDMESVKVPGVYFAGEVLDVDGMCGGYNLQWAWTSGYLAGLAAAQSNRMGD